MNCRLSWVLVPILCAACTTGRGGGSSREADAPGARGSTPFRSEAEVGPSRLATETERLLDHARALTRDIDALLAATDEEEDARASEEQGERQASGFGLRATDQAGVTPTLKPEAWSLKPEAWSLKPEGAPQSAIAAPPGDPTETVVPLPAAAGWEASLVLDRGKVGLWTVGAFPVFKSFGCPEIVGLDDEGRVHVLASYSGTWTPIEAVHDLAWLGGLAHGDLDPRAPGDELYVGGKRGNVYQVRAYEHGALDARLIAHLPGRQVHCLAAAWLDRHEAGDLLVFTKPGALYRLTPTGAHGEWETALVGEFPGRIRDCVELPTRMVELPAFATASVGGRVEVLRFGATGPTWELIHQQPQGAARLALRPDAAGPQLVLYSAWDDGRIMRHERAEEGAGPRWRTETVSLGPPGPRGLAAGRFHEDPARESVAVFGYSGAVELLTRGAAEGAPGSAPSPRAGSVSDGPSGAPSRRAGSVSDGPSGAPSRSGWQAETLFTDRDKGHYLAVAEVEGRNGTDELIGCGYGGRIFLLARPPGFARAGLVPAAPAPPAEGR